MALPRILCPAFLLFLSNVLAVPVVCAQHLEAERFEEVDSLRINQLQVIGSHNSFKSAIDPSLYEILVGVVPDARKLDYAHPTLTDQLNLGLRNLELDIFYDPEGGRYANPLGLKMVQLAGKQPRPYDPKKKMLAPGFKVLHIQDIDFRSNCLTLVDALEELRQWSSENPHHLTVFVTFNLSDNPIELPGSVKPLRFNNSALDELDQVLIATLGREKLLIPDDVRGDSESLETAVKTSGWPTIGESRGKFLLIMDDLARKKKMYLADHQGLHGRTMFVNSKPGTPEAAVMIQNNPLTDGNAITDLVRQGYLVRTRADAATKESRTGDYSRFQAAKQCGAQIISSDYCLADWHLNPDYRIRFKDGGCYRFNPVTGPREERELRDVELE